MTFSTLIEAQREAHDLNEIDCPVYGCWTAEPSTARPGRFTVVWRETYR